MLVGSSAMSGVRVQILLLITVAVVVWGCRSPFTGGDAQPSLKQIVDQAVTLETASPIGPTGPAETQPESQRQTTQPASDVVQTLSGRWAELQAIGPDISGDPSRFDLGFDLTGAPQQRIAVSLGDAISGSLSRNLSTETARLQPGIARQDVIAAQAVFDAVLFTNADLNWTDEPAAVPVLLGNPLTSPFNRNQSYRFETGVRKQFASGAQATLSTDLTRFNNDSPGLILFPDPAYTAAARLGVTQPLLRGFGTDVTQASIRIASNVEKRAVEDLRVNLMQTALDTESAYWNLVQAWRELAIRQWLVDQGVKVRNILEIRREHDTKPAQYSDAVARIEQRKADVIRARRQIRAASDALKILINDPQMTIGSESVLWPQDDVVDSPISYNLREAMMSAIDHRPEIQRAILGIDDADIRQRFAGSQRLPLLNLSAEMAYFGLDRHAGDAYSNMNEGRFIDYILGLAFEYPLGNRSAEAGFQQARLRRSAAVIAYQQAVQNVVLDVKLALRDVLTNYELIGATRSFRVAQAENLRTLQVEKQNTAALTPEFLNLEFTRQETLAQARHDEVAALVNFAKSVADLHRAMGIGLNTHGVAVEQDQSEE